MKHMLNGPPKYKPSEGIVEAAMCTHGMSTELRHEQESGGFNIGHGCDIFTFQLTIYKTLEASVACNLWSYVLTIWRC